MSNPSPSIPVKVDDRDHYVIAPAWRGWTVTLRRIGEQPETHLADTYPEAMRLARHFAAAGLVGFVGGTEPPQVGRFARARQRRPA